MRNSEISRNSKLCPESTEVGRNSENTNLVRSVLFIGAVCRLELVQ